MTVVFDELLDEFGARGSAVVADLTEDLNIDELAELLVADEVRP